MKGKNLSIEAGRELRSIAARAAAFLPGSSESFGPPRRAMTSLAVSEEPVPVKRHSLIAARSTIRPAAQLADPPLEMMQPASASIKEVYVAELPQGRYWGRFHGYILDREDTLLSDLSATFTPADRRHDGLDQLKLPPLKEIAGKVAVINTLFSDNFHHWLLDTLPRFEWLRRAGWDWSEIDYFILPKKLASYHFEALELLGIGKEKVIRSDGETHIRADLLLVPSHSEPSANPGEFDYTPEGLRFVRDLFLTGNPFLEKKHPARVLVSREKAKARRLVQAESANPRLFALGFEKVLLEDYSVREQAAFFHQAECVVMPTGGNLANFVFCRPGTTAIELFSKNYVPPFTHALMREIGLRYYGIVADQVSRPFPEARAANEDIDIDPDRLAAIVGEALATSSAATSGNSVAVPPPVSKG